MPRSGHTALHGVAADLARRMHLPDVGPRATGSAPTAAERRPIHGSAASMQQVGPAAGGVLMTSANETVAATLDQPTMRSLVVETNDGIIATAGVVEGFVGSGSTGSTLILAALSSLIAGGIALGGGRYSEEISERDARDALIAEERDQLRRDPVREFAELVAIYEAKGLSSTLARSVAAELSSTDPLAAHIDAEHQLPLRTVREAPLIIGVAAGLAFALGALVPLVAVLITPDGVRPEATAAAAVVGLVATSVFLSLMGVRSITRTLLRSMLVALLAAGLSLLAGWVMHP